MNPRLQTLIIGAFFALFNLVHSDAAGISLSVAPELNTYVIRQPVILVCKYTNATDESQTLDLGFNDMQNVSFIVEQQNNHERKPTQTPRLIPGLIPGDVTIAPHQSIVRYLAFDQWFRATSPGAFEAEMIGLSRGEKVTAKFKISFSASDAELFKAGLESMADKFVAFKANGKNIEYRERKSYEYAFRNAFSYVETWPAELLSKLISKYGGGSELFTTIRESQNIGPGGCRFLD